MVCRACGAVADVFASLPPVAVRRLREACPFALDTHAINFNGLCPSCQAGATSPRVAARPASVAGAGVPA